MKQKDKTDTIRKQLDYNTEHATIQTLIDKSVKVAEHDLLKQMGSEYIMNNIADELQGIIDENGSDNDRVSWIFALICRLRKGELE